MVMPDSMGTSGGAVIALLGGLAGLTAVGAISRRRTAPLWHPPEDAGAGPMGEVPSPGPGPSHGSTPPIGPGPPLGPGPSPGSGRWPVPPSVEGRTSMTTYLPGLTGFLMLVAALPDAIRGRALPVSVVAALAGSFVVVTGFLARVTRIDADLHGLAIRYAARPPVRLPWPTVLALRGPSTVLGGWRVEAGSGRGRTLMPSDL